MSTAASTVLSLVALALAAAAVVLATIANRRLVRRGRSTARPETDQGGPPPDREPGVDPAVGVGRDPVRAELDALAAVLADATGRVEALGHEVADATGRVEALGHEVADVRTVARAAALATGSDPTALRHVAVVRYDAFADVGGRLSYSVAVLDDTRSGLVLTTLAGKSDVRTYVRTISAGGADGTLTAEEQQAIEAAVPTGSAP